LKFQIGDRVLILHSGEEAEVIDIINDKMLLVDVEGVQFPVYMDQVDFPYLKRFSGKAAPPPVKEKKYIDDIRKEKPGSIEKTEDGMWLTFLPLMKTDDAGEEVVWLMKLHLINNTRRKYKFIYELHFSGRPDFDLKNELHPFEDFYLHDILFESMNDNPSFAFKFSPAVHEKELADYYETSLRMKPKQLFSRLAELKEKNEPSFSFRLFETYPLKKPKQEIYLPELSGKEYYDATQIRQRMEAPLSVIDLHIEKLTDEWDKMSSQEMLNLQLRTFEKYYDLAIAHLQPGLTVIHGIGEGKLRDAIHKILEKKPEVRSFVNQYHPLYGFGATEIFFRY
jgi:hypothetical protein